MGKRIIFEYVWCDSTGVSSKTMIIPINITFPKSWNIKNDVSWIPQWNVNKKLIPSYWCMDPFRMKIMNDRQVNDTLCIIVLCKNDEKNFQYEQVKAAMKQNKTDNKLISITQNYMVRNGKGHPTKHMSKIAEQHLWLCIAAGLDISEVNVNKHTNQPSYRIGLCKGIDVANQLTLSKYIMERLIDEKYSSYGIYWSSREQSLGCFISYVGESSIVFKQVGIETIWQCEHNAIQKSIQQLTIPMLQSNYKSILYTTPYDALTNLHNESQTNILH